MRENDDVRLACGWMHPCVVAGIEAAWRAGIDCGSMGTPSALGLTMRILHVAASCPEQDDFSSNSTSSSPTESAKW